MMLTIMEPSGVRFSFTAPSVVSDGSQQLGQGSCDLNVSIGSVTSVSTVSPMNY